MKPKQTGVTEYTIGRSQADVAFPNHDVCCLWCWLYLQCDHDLKRYRCKLTGEPIPYPSQQIGAKCPLIFTIKEEEHGNPCNDPGGERDGEKREPAEL